MLCNIKFSRVIDLGMEYKNSVNLLSLMAYMVLNTMDLLLGTMRLATWLSLMPLPATVGTMAPSQVRMKFGLIFNAMALPLH